MAEEPVKDEAVEDTATEAEAEQVDADAEAKATESGYKCCGVF